MQQHLKHFLSEAVSQTDTLVVAVSGGTDSLALAHLMAAVWPAKQTIVAHLNHGLRKNAQKDAEFVQAFSAENKLTCEVGFIDVPALVKQSGQSVEEAARSARYHFLTEVATKYHAAAILTAHHADDQAETILMHLLRGSGLGGLRGMSLLAVVPTGNATDVKLLRPLLKITRSDLEAYCKKHKLKPVDDETNRDVDYLRNRLRHVLLPELTTYNPQIKQQLNQFGELATADEVLLRSLTETSFKRLVREQGDGWLRLDLAAWQKLPLSLRRRTLRQGVATLIGLNNVGFRPIENARVVAERGQVGQQSPLPGGVDVVIGYADLTFVEAGVEPTQQAPQLISAEPTVVQVPGVTLLADGWRMVTTWRSAHDVSAVVKNPHEAMLAVSMESELHLRARSNGDKMQPLGMKGKSRKLKDIMIDEKIPQKLRKRWPVLVSAENPLWVIGYMVDERARVTADTDMLLHVRVVAPQQ